MLEVRVRIIVSRVRWPRMTVRSGRNREVQGGANVRMITVPSWVPALSADFFCHQLVLHGSCTKQLIVFQSQVESTRL